MKQRNMWAILGLSALGITLIALPGSSSQKQDPATPAPPAKDCAEENIVVEPLPRAEFAEQLTILKDRLHTLATEIQEGNPKVRVDDEPQVVDDEDDVQIFTSGSWLGVGVSEVSSEKMKSLKLAEERGAVLGKIVPDSPASKAGLKENDVVLAINGQRVEGTEQFRRMIREIPAGRTANLTIWRDGRSQNIKVTLARLEANNLKVFSSNPQSFSFKMPQLPAMPDLSGLNHLRTFALVSPDHPVLGLSLIHI